MEGKKAQGGKELKNYLSGKVLTARQTILAKCYECCCGYIDGKNDCKVETCPNYFYFPYREIKPDKQKRIRSEKQIANDGRFGRKSSGANKNIGLQKLKPKRVPNYIQS